MSNENKQKVPAKETPEIKLTNLKTEITWIIIGCFFICLIVKFLLPLAPNMLEANYSKSDFLILIKLCTALLVSYLVIVVIKYWHLRIKTKTELAMTKAAHQNDVALIALLLGGAFMIMLIFLS